nr:NEP1-like protein 1 [Plasmopara viticola]
MSPWEAKWIRHSDVRPFPQPEPMTVEEKVAVMLKPELHVSSGCHPYPAVNDLGETNGGLKTTGAPSGMCKGSGWGSQFTVDTHHLEASGPSCTRGTFQKTCRRHTSGIATTGST